MKREVREREKEEEREREEGKRRERVPSLPPPTPPLAYVFCQNLELHRLHGKIPSAETCIQLWNAQGKSIIFPSAWEQVHSFLEFLSV